MWLLLLALGFILGLMGWKWWKAGLVTGVVGSLFGTLGIALLIAPGVIGLGFFLAYFIYGALGAVIGKWVRGKRRVEVG